MTIRKTKVSCILLIIIIITGFLFAFYGHVLINPNNYLLSQYGDGVKNYYIPSYYVQYDHGVRFNGMDYPFGDQVLFTDNQFPLTYFLTLLQQNGIHVSGYTISIINVFLLLSIYLCAIFIWMLLYGFGANEWIAAIMAAGITLLSPQMERLTGHYSLSYLCFIPGAMLGIQRLIISKRKWTWWLFMIFFQIFFGLMHLYFLAMMFMFISWFVALYWLKGFLNKTPAYKVIFFIASSAIVALLSIELFLHLTDPVTDRTKCPWGIEGSIASPYSVFVPPVFNPFNVFKINYSSWEGFGYIGLVSDLAMLIFMVLLVRAAFKKQVSPFLKSHFKNNLEIFVLASIPVLLFSMLIPFSSFNYFLLDIFTFIRQFRSPGRFNWVFYYIINIWSVLFLFSLIKTLYTSHKKVISITAGVLIIIVLFREADVNVLSPSGCISRSGFKNSFYNNPKWNDRLHEAGLNASDFQAILVLPIFHIGSEKFWIPQDTTGDSAMEISYNTGLPMAEGDLGRTSFSQTYKLIQISADTLIQKSIYPSFPDKRPILLITIKSKLSQGDNYLVKKSKLLFTFSNLTFYSMPISILKNNFKNVRKHFFETRDSLYHSGNFYTSRQTSSIISRSLAANDSALFLSKGEFRTHDQLALYNGIIPGSSDSELFEFSIWNKIFNDVDGFPYIFYSQYNQSGRKIDSAMFDANTSQDVYPNWARSSINFILFNKKNTVKFNFWSNKKFEAERMLIRPFGVSVYYNVKDDSSFVLNNFPIPANDDSIIHF